MKNEKIKSRWEVSANEMSDRNIDYLLRNNRGFVKKIAANFVRKFPEYDFNEIYSIVQEGFYKAMLAYKPEKGNLAPYAFFYCKSYLSFYIKKFYRSNEKEINVIDIDYISENKILVDDVIFLKEIKEILTDEENEILEAYIYSDGKNIGNSITESIKGLGISKWKFKKKLKTILAKIKKII